MMNKTTIATFLLSVFVFGTDNMQAQQGCYELVFRDEFNLPNGSRPDPKKWSTSKRENSTWGRWVSQNPNTAYIKHGCLVCRAIPNRGIEPTDTAAMLTGAVETQGKFSFQYGKIEVRMRTRHHRGNFPAAWLMPQPPCKPWPHNGEIDIFETIDNQNMAYHTAHSYWTLHVNTRVKHGCTKPTKVTQWHVYGLIWTPTSLTWTIDGVPTESYLKSNNEKDVANGQWPYDHPFYIILNQSVGRKGAWAAEADTMHIYKTEFDWVRVYKLVQ